MYFTNEVDKAIIQYNNLTKGPKRDRLYNREIYPALDKLAENIINTFKFPYIDGSFQDLKHDVVAFCTQKLDRFSPNSGKAYSYFSIVSKNYLIARNKKEYKKLKQKADLDVIDQERDITSEISRQDHCETLESFIEEWIHYMDANIDSIFTDETDIKIANSLLEIFKYRKSIDAFNKRALYVLIREQTELKTQRITKTVKIIKQQFYELLNEYRS